MKKYHHRTPPTPKAGGPQYRRHHQRIQNTDPDKPTDKKSDDQSKSIKGINKSDTQHKLCINKTSLLTK
ncbi:hypothetical protein, partial [Acidipropionibacterium jensenii]|uniref:hypothetical protein n=1 Tax=Acidipropionibacterium jensenii TaxID=1749 RepID=UPI001B7FD1CA